MKRWLPAVALLGIAVAVGLYLRPTRSPNPPAAASGLVVTAAVLPPASPAPPPAALAQALGIASPIPAPAANSPAGIPPAPVASVVAVPIAPEPAPVLPPAIVLENMRSVIHEFGSRFNGNPVGTNPEITKALTGGNSGQVNFLRPDSGLRVNDKGELIDAWGTPFFFHQLAAREMEIRSAGPDRKMWTADDLVTK